MSMDRPTPENSDFNPDQRLDEAQLDHESQEQTAPLKLREEVEEQSASETPPPPPPVRKLGRYDLLNILGQGGMGLVMRGHDPKLGRDLAIKVMTEQYSKNPAVRQRFLEEAQLGGQLQHPNILPVYELGELPDKRLYFTMKLIKGRSLLYYLKKRQSPQEDLQKLLTMFEQICQAMAYAHSRGVVHRDLKPANIMVGAFGEVQVMDWGLSKVLPRQKPHQPPAGGREDHTIIRTVRKDSVNFQKTDDDTRFGVIIGTPDYMPPEQARGLVDQLDERCDVFALGGILCEILTGDPPYVAETRRELLKLSATGDLRQCFENLHASGMDPELIELAKRCLTASPTHRCRDAGEIVEAFQSYLASVQERRPESEWAIETNGKQARRKSPFGYVVLALGFFALVLAAFVFYLRGIDVQQPSKLQEVAAFQEQALKKIQQAQTATNDQAALQEAQQLLIKSQESLKSLSSSNVD